MINIFRKRTNFESQFYVRTFTKIIVYTYVGILLIILYISISIIYIKIIVLVLRNIYVIAMNIALGKKICIKENQTY